MKKIIVTLMITGSLYAQDDIILKSAGTDATKGILFQNSNADTLMDIDGDGLISIFGTLNTVEKLRLYAPNKAQYLEFFSWELYFQCFVESFRRWRKRKHVHWSRNR